MNKKLDLHGIPHYAVALTVENFLNLNTPPVEIITGNSEDMKLIVNDVANTLGLDSLNMNPNNLGCVTIIEKL